MPIWDATTPATFVLFPHLSLLLDSCRLASVEILLQSPHSEHFQLIIWGPTLLPADLCLFACSCLDTQRAVSPGGRTKALRRNALGTSLQATAFESQGTNTQTPSDKITQRQIHCVFLQKNTSVTAVASELTIHAD